MTSLFFVYKKEPEGSEFSVLNSGWLIDHFSTQIHVATGSTQFKFSIGKNGYTPQIFTLYWDYSPYINGGIESFTATTATGYVKSITEEEYDISITLIVFYKSNTL